MALTVSYGHARHVVVTDEAIITVERRSEEERRQASTAALIESLVVTPWQLKMTLKREAARDVAVSLAPWDYRKVRAHLSRAGYL